MKGIGGITSAYPFIPHRHTAQGHSVYLYAGETDWLNREIRHPANL